MNKRYAQVVYIRGIGLYNQHMNPFWMQVQPKLFFKML